jgi:AraC-like DNA-binding protein
MEKKEKDSFRSKLSKRIIRTPSPAAKKAFFYIQETGILKPEDATVSHREAIESFLIAAVISGSGTLSIDGANYSLSAGDCFFIDCRIPHSFSSSENDPWEVEWTHFNGATSEQYYEYFLSQNRNVFHPVYFDRIVSVINDIISTSEKKTPDSEITASKLIVELLTLALTVNISGEQYDSALKQKLAAVNAYIEEHFNEDLSLEEISSRFYISKFYLTREYKKIYGNTIFQHIITARINYGKQLLRFSDKSVEEIAHLCGFNDQSYFARQFKKAENLTCFAYRKKWRS